MIITRSIDVRAGDFGGRLQGLDRNLLRGLAMAVPLRMPYLVAVRIVLPNAQPVWRLDGTRGGGSLLGAWWNYATSNAATQILPPFVAAGPLADWQQAHIYPGIPLADGGDDCGLEWLQSTTLTLTTSLPAVGAYTASVTLNIVAHPKLRS